MIDFPAGEFVLGMILRDSTNLEKAISAGLKSELFTNDFEDFMLWQKMHFHCISCG
jgi:hypothetical protein